MKSVTSFTALVSFVLFFLPAPAPAQTWHFTDVTTAAGVAYEHGYLDTAYYEPRFTAGGVAAGDYDGDGWIDLYAVRGDIGPNLLFRNRGDGRFEEVGAAAGVALVGTHGSGPTFADFDGDGELDLLILGVGNEDGSRRTTPRLFRGRGDGTFVDVTESSGIVATRDSYSSVFGDYDRDGDLDLFITHWGTELGDELPKELLWRNEGNGTFTDVSQAAGLSQFLVGQIDQVRFDFTFTPNFADVDNDGWPDLLLANDFRTSRVLLNARDGTFRNATTAAISDENGMGGAIGDYDNDGDLDWFVSSVYDADGRPEGNWGVSGNRLYRNRGDGIFTDVTTQSGVRDGYWGWASTFADFNNDGHLDLFHVNGWGRPEAEEGAEYRTDPSRLFVANGDGTFTERAEELGTADRGQGRGAVAFDYDRDGDLDLFIANNAEPARLFRNDGGNANHFLRVTLRGRGPNTRAVGARVFVTAGGSTQMRELRAGSNFVSQDPTEAHFGLGSAAEAETVRVVWPGGEVTDLGRIGADQHLEVTQPVPISCAAEASDNPCVPGGGRRGVTDCHLEWVVTPTPPVDRRGWPARVLRCTEGDANCDTDPDPRNGSCRFQLAPCVSNADQRLPHCASSAVTTFELLHPRAGSPDPADAALRADLEAQAGGGLQGLGLTIMRSGAVIDAGQANGGTPHCSLPVYVHVVSGGRRVVAAAVTTAAGKRDVDRLVFQCQ